ncbi:MAG: universal stress protein, partial [Myxococcales bacterium]|nr:universal stress protein [Myxococcales bacterium]
REGFDHQLEQEGLRSRVAAAELVFGVSAEDVLAKRVGGVPDSVLVVGRRAPRGSTGFTRLGKVARRLVRTLPAPVVVVPPDFEVERAPGPVVLATSLREDSEGTARFAARIARDWNRPLLVVNVIPGTAGVPPRYLPEVARDEVVARGRLDAEHGLAIWQRRHGLRDAESLVETGDSVDRLTGLAFERRASLIVVGSRQLSLRARVYRSSVGSDLAGSATVPVAVVPPPPPPTR